MSRSMNSIARLLIYEGNSLDLQKAIESYGFAKSGDNDHIMLDLSDFEKVTISIKLDNGKLCNFSVVPRASNGKII